MAYVSLSLPKGLSTHVLGAVQHGAEPFLREAHAMLGIRLPGDPGRQLQLSIAINLLATISGISATLYAREASSRRQFIGVLREYYPWNIDRPEGLTPGDAAELLYEEFRNPFAHSLGLRTQGGKRLKVGLVFGSTDVEALARAASPGHPSLESSGDKVVLWVDSLYWGVRRMIETMAGNSTLMVEADAFIQQGRFAPPWKR